MYPNAGSAPVQSVPTDVNAERHGHGDEASGSRRPRFGSPDGEYSYHDGRGGPRGVFRGGSRGRWYEGRGKRDGRDHFRDRDRDRAKRSRSRSPPSRYGARREIKPYSPPRRPMAAVRESLDTGGESQPSAGDAEIDEFGRTRPPSDNSKDAAFDSQKKEAHQKHSVPNPTSQPLQPQQPAIAKQPSTSSGSNLEQPNNTSPGLEQFNVASFDFTSPASWEELGKMWSVSYGSVPTTEQLMQFVMLAGTSMDPSQMWSSQNSWDQSGQWDNLNSNSYMDSQGMSVGGDGQKSGMGMGNNGSGNYYQDQSSNNGDGNWRTGTDPRINRGSIPAQNTTGTSSSQSSGEKRVGGGMRKVGDKWMFVRDGDTGVS
ncbi:hypothetical protein GYMLUDRAFT_438860 [Collybiopsis luxurians FD-317 M1]|uniref:Uncharacterized protein n=1 Tax=Collybiopsis luxurians FD-317 M1 TaxID=944289 RepID=A0A0D0AK79_9AGAR|nr:hypothetical protein GYMLUDRAFT_438860 [Collybiopsis luxurians FD-317 M1]